jgi:dihydrofolate reductase
MGELVVHMYVTLDGVMQAPGEPGEDREGGFEHGGWQVPYLDEEAGTVIGEQYAGMDALLLGRRTYEIFAAYWPTAPADNPFGPLLNEAPKYVASRTLDTLGWDNSTLLGDDVPGEVARLKQEYGQVHVAGSGDLLQTLLRHDLVDRFNLWVSPVVLGTGKRLFAGGAVPAAYRLVEARAFGSGVVLLVYERAGAPTYGDMAGEARAGEARAGEAKAGEARAGG